MAYGWGGFLEALKPEIAPYCGGEAGADNLIAQVKEAYSNPNYHGYNLVYEADVGTTNISHCVVARKPAAI